MPVYEYRCNGCRRVTSVFVRTISDPKSPACDHCGNADLDRVMSRVAYHRTMDRVWEESGPPAMDSGDDYYRDPRNIGRWMEQRLEQTFAAPEVVVDGRVGDPQVRGHVLNPDRFGAALPQAFLRRLQDHAPCLFPAPAHPGLRFARRAQDLPSTIHLE